jgi:hypothetical protein
MEISAARAQSPGDRAIFVPEPAENHGLQRSPTGTASGLRRGHAQVGPLRETTCDENVVPFTKRRPGPRTSEQS